ncbi:MAG: glycosyltransferase family 39 protein, partial [Limisphaerales bacterium]
RERLVDPDEGAYMLAAKLVMEGKVIYSDFFWPQMPLLPYAYGIWMKIFGTNWYAARYLSGFLGVAMGLLLFFHVVRLTGKQSWGFLAVILFAFSSFSIGWFATTKTYSLSTFLLFAAYLFLVADRLKEWKCIAAGAFLGLAVSTRLYFVGLIPVFFWLVYREEKRWPYVWQCAAGLLLGSVPSFFFLLKNPDNFYFDNIGYHFLRSDYDFGSSIQQKLESVPRLLGWGLTEGFIGIQFALLLLANAYFIYQHMRAKKKLPASLVLTLFLIPLLFIPTPTHLQYFSSLLPFLVLNAVWAFSDKVKELRPKKIGAAGLMRAVAVAGMVYAVMGMADFYQYCYTGKKVPGIGGGPEYAQFWKIPYIQSISRLIDQNTTAEGEPVMSFWPGYLLESKAAIWPGMENHSNVVITTKLLPSQMKKYRIVSLKEIFLGVLEGKTRLVILEVWDRGPGRASLVEALKQSGFSLILQIGTKEIYKWTEKK